MRPTFIETGEMVDVQLGLSTRVAGPEPLLVGPGLPEQPRLCWEPGKAVVLVLATTTASGATAVPVASTAQVAVAAARASTGSSPARAVLALRAS